MKLTRVVLIFDDELVAEGTPTDVYLCDLNLNTGGKDEMRVAADFERIYLNEHRGDDGVSRRLKCLDTNLETNLDANLDTNRQLRLPGF